MLVGVPQEAALLRRDQGGCCETTRATTHRQPTYRVDEVVHYCVANMPGALARTATMALNNATLPFVLELADRGVWAALADDRHLRNGLNVCRGQITHAAVARDLGYTFAAPEPLIESAAPSQEVA
jgi:alanine dehydrogenase